MLQSISLLLVFSSGIMPIALHLPAQQDPQPELTFINPFSLSTRPLNTKQSSEITKTFDGSYEDNPNTNAKWPQYSIPPYIDHSTAELLHKLADNFMSHHATHSHSNTMMTPMYDYHQDESSVSATLPILNDQNIPLSTFTTESDGGSNINHIVDRHSNAHPTSESNQQNIMRKYYCDLMKENDSMYVEWLVSDLCQRPLVLSFHKH
eukprot:335345_1